MGDLVVIGNEDGVWEVSALFYNQKLELIYIVRKNGQLREVKESYIMRYTGKVDDLR